jgi:hypothetical protein
VVSIGVCVERERFSDALRKPEGLLRFLREHRALATLLERAEPLDHGSLGQLAHGTRRFFDGRARWALVGDAAAFADPLYSPGGDFIAVENDWVTDLVTRDLAGEPVGARAAAFERAARARFELTVELYRGLYPLLGSFELMRARWAFDSASYLNLLAEPYFLDEHLDLDALARAPHERALGALRSFRELFERGAARARARWALLREEPGRRAPRPGRAVRAPRLRHPRGEAARARAPAHHLPGGLRRAGAARRAVAHAERGADALRPTHQRAAPLAEPRAAG